MDAKSDVICFRWSDSGTSLPRLQSADPAAFRGSQDAVFEEARAGLQGQRMSLLERTASVGAVPDPGLPRSHTAAGNLQVTPGLLQGA